MTQKSLLNTQDYTKNYWTCHPDMKTVPMFRKIYDEDKDITKRNSSKFMWFVALTNDYKSTYYDLADYGQHGKYTILGNTLFGDSEYYVKNHKKFEKYIEMYLAMTETQVRRSLRVWENKLKERDAFLEDNKFTADYVDEETGETVKGNYKMIEDMMKNNKVLFDHYKQIYNELLVENGKNKGGRINTSEIID